MPAEVAARSAKMGIVEFDVTRLRRTLNVNGILVSFNPRPLSQHKIEWEESEFEREKYYYIDITLCRPRYRYGY
jgi:hypothetical protein